jgi:predicted ATP-dependent endonuclease of OLD family
VKLTSARVRMFQNIIDSGEVAIEDDVTCLVGKNESGKTAFLQALTRLNPAIKGEGGFEPRDDYPRWLWKRDEKAAAVNDTVPIEATFALEPEDVAAVEEALGSKVLANERCTVSRTYGNKWRHHLDLNEGAAVRHLISQIPKGHAARKAAQGVTTVDDLWNSIGPKEDAVEDAAAEAPVEANPDIDTLVERVGELSDEDGLRNAAWKILIKRLPRFFYFGQYSGLPGRVPLSRLLDQDRAELDESENTAVALLRLAGVERNDLREEDFERRVAELEASANEITRQVFEYWTQNQRLRVQFVVDKKIEQDPKTQVMSVIEYYLDIRLDDQQHQFTTNFETRSHGFQWFFSFIAAFTEFEGEPERVIVLLDEPGLALHARAQNDFLRFINDRLAAKHQVVYSTHSPWMIEPTALRRARLVEDDPDTGSTITSDVLSTDPDTVFPLYAAFGYDLAQNLFVGLNNLVVEGTSDFVYLSEVSRRLQNEGREHLDLTRWTIVPVGGAGKVATFVALLGPKLNVTVLVDTDAKLNQELTSLITKGLLEEQRLITVGQISGAAKADIEDLFSVDEYLAMYNAAFGTTVAQSDLDADSKRPIVKRFGAEFDHGLPAEQMLRDPAKFVDSLSKETLKRFQKLFALVNQTTA